MSRCRLLFIVWILPAVDIYRVGERLNIRVLAVLVDSQAEVPSIRCITFPSFPEPHFLCEVLLYIWLGVSVSA